MSGLKAPSKSALDVWAATALRPVELPTGMKALVVLPNVADMVRKGALPQELRALATKYAVDGIEVSKLGEDDLVKFVRFMFELIARAIRALAVPSSTAWEPDDDGWEPVSLTGARLAEMDVDQADIDALSQLVGRQKTANEITAASRTDRGILTARPVPETGGGETVGDFAGFRGQSGGAERGNDGGDVRGAAVGDAGDQRSGRRLQRGRGARASS